MEKEKEKEKRQATPIIWRRAHRNHLSGDYVSYFKQIIIMRRIYN